MKRIAVVILAPLWLASCGGWQSALDPHSNQAGHLADLFWLFTAVCAVVWLLVVAALLWTVRRRSDDERPEEDSVARTHRKNFVVTGLVVATGLILAGLALVSFYATRGIAWPNQQTIHIKVTGQQWWWEVEYQNNDPAQVFTTANEIHIPVGRPVTFELHATDVIHSFWVPDLMGKQDLIPGRTNFITLEADRPGLYRGQCAEFCGLQHAHMAIFVFAEPQSVFEAWRRHQIQPIGAPANAQAMRGETIFTQRQCASCHAVTGTDAGGETGPDLTHFGSHATIAAGLLRNTPANLTRWIRGPQVLKPGANMPKVDMSDSDRAAIVAFLEEQK